jgi:hypothetical protein
LIEPATPWSDGLVNFRGTVLVVLGLAGGLVAAPARAKPKLDVDVAGPVGPAPKTKSPTTPTPTPTPITGSKLGPAVDPAGNAGILQEPFVDPCPSPTSCPQADVDGDGIPDHWEDKLAGRFAPEVRLAPASEDWARPASVDWYLQRVHMRFENKGACNGDVTVLGVGAVTQENIANRTAREKNMTWKGCRSSGKLHSSASSTRFFLQPPDDAVHNGAPASQWRAYVHVRNSPTLAGGYDVQYWFFYAYNDAFGSFNHEGDWERVTVTATASGEFHRANYSQHETSTTYTAAQLTFVHDTHPVVYSADGSHANYPKAGSFGIEDAPVDDHAYEGGPKWETWKSFVNVGEKNAPRQGQTFIQYGGRWGEIGETSWTSGPTGPAFKSAW